MQARGRAPNKTRQPLVIPHWLRGLALAFVGAIVLQGVVADFTGFPRAALVMVLYLLVLAAAADVVWHVWTSRKPATIAALTGTNETVPVYDERVRAWVSGITLVLAAGVTVLHGGEALSVLRAWAQLHRWAPAQIGLKVIPSTIAAHQPFHVTVLVDNGVATGYRCEWQGPIAEWVTENGCDLQRMPPQHFVEPDWPMRRVAVSAKVLDGDRLLGTTPTRMLTITYAPIVDLVMDKTRILQGQRAEFRVRVDGQAPGPDDHCRWTVGGEFASSDGCTFAYTGTDLNSAPTTPVRIAVEVTRGPSGSTSSAEATLVVDQPQFYTLYLLDASKRMGGQTPTGTFLDNVKSDLVDEWSNVDLGRSFLGIATFGADAPRHSCYQNVQVAYPVQSLNLSEAKSTLYLVQPGSAQAPFATALLQGLTLLEPYAGRGADPASFALVSIAGGQDSCAGGTADAAEKTREALMDGVRKATALLGQRLLTLTIGISTSEPERQAWDDLARYAPTQSPYVIVPAPDAPTLDRAVKAAVALGGRDYAARIAGCGDLARMLATGGFAAGAAQVHRYCQSLSAQ